METNNQTMSAFCGNTLEMQNCRESPSVLSWSSFLQKIGLDFYAPRGQRQGTKDAAGSEAGMERAWPEAGCSIPRNQLSIVEP